MNYFTLSLGLATFGAAICTSSAAAAEPQRVYPLHDRGDLRAPPVGGYLSPTEYLEALSFRRETAEKSSASPVAGKANPTVTWSSRGPTNIAGRSRALAIDPSNANHVLLGTASGGLWRSVDGGTTWSLATGVPTVSIGAITFSPSNPSTIWVGTGDGMGTGGPGSSIGMFRSQDGGVTWAHVPTTTPGTGAWVDQYNITRVAISPSNPLIIAVATDRSVLRSADGGASWAVTLSSAQTGFALKDLDTVSNSGSTLVATRNGFPSSTAFTSLDFGATWTASALPAGVLELGISASSPSNRYALSSVANGTLYASTNSGATWTARPSTNLVGSQPNWNSALWVDPANHLHVIVGGLELHRSTDGGNNFSRAHNQCCVGGSVIPHVDQHDIVIAPSTATATTKAVYVVNDGGVYRHPSVPSTGSLDLGVWQDLNAGVTSVQFYGIAGFQQPFSLLGPTVAGGTQDNGSIFSATGNYWLTFAPNSDGSTVQISRTLDPGRLFGHVFGLGVVRYDSFAGTYFLNFISQPITETFSLAPLAFSLSRQNENLLAVGINGLWVSNNALSSSPTWSKVVIPGATGQSTATRFAESATHSNRVWLAGYSSTSALTRIHRCDLELSRLHKSGCVDVTPQQCSFLPPGSCTPGLAAQITYNLLPDPTDGNVVFASGLGNGLIGGTFAASLLKSTDAGATWTTVSAGVPRTITAFARHPLNPSILIVGTHVGALLSFDAGASWTPVNDGPGMAHIVGLDWADDQTLVVGTHGRGAFIAKFTP